MSIYIYAFATFGHPNDFRQTPFSYNNEDIAKKIKVFDLSNAIKVFPNSEIYSIRKESIENTKLIAYSIYTYAQEQASKRDGTFIGSSIILENKLSDEDIVIKCLNNFHLKLTENNLENGVLKVNHSRDFIPVGFLKDSDNVKNFHREIKDLSFIQTNKSLVVFCETAPNKLKFYFEKAISLLNLYDVIYFTQSKEVAEYVMQKGIFPLIQNVGEKQEFEHELQKLKEEKLRRVKALLENFSNEKRILETDREHFKEKYDKSINQMQKTHQENEQKIKSYKNERPILDNYYLEFLKKIDELIYQLESTGEIETAREKFNEYNRTFANKINNNQIPSSLNHILQPANLTTNTQPSFIDKANIPNRHRNSDGTNREGKSNVFKLTTITLSLLLMGTLAYFLIFKESNQEIPTNDFLNELDQRNHIEANETIENKRLTPEANLELDRESYLAISEKLKYGNKVEDIVDIIFQSHPDINNSYYDQKEIYAKNLIDLNRVCFEKKMVYFSSPKTL